ncbi:MAG: phosphoribosylanthranilate isomerase [Lachnospiraceae bacterium]|nr:phosphoribosylanthranilate isomerase [Lachnospiraceae bacterium]
MTQIKLCGLSRPQDIATANALRPDYIGFVFAKASRRYVAPETAAKLRALLDPGIRAVGVFVNETPEQVAALLSEGVIDIAQLHGAEDEAYIRRLRQLTDKPVIKAFRLGTADGAAERARKVLSEAMASSADMVLLDSGAGTGMVLNWEFLKGFPREYFLAGGLTPENVGEAVFMLRPAAVDVSSGIETDGVKDAAKMQRFVAAVREAEAVGFGKCTEKGRGR